MQKWTWHRLASAEPQSPFAPPRQAEENVPQGLPSRPPPPAPPPLPSRPSAAKTGDPGEEKPPQGAPGWAARVWLGAHVRWALQDLTQKVLSHTVLSQAGARASAGFGAGPTLAGNLHT